MQKVLVVDDSAAVRREVSAALEGFEVLEACDGVEGTAAVKNNQDLLLVICDVNMPRMDGLEMLEALRGFAPDLPVVMLTTEGQRSLISKARKLGAKGWIVKPFDPGQLLGAARRIASRAT